MLQNKVHLDDTPATTPSVTPDPALVTSRLSLPPLQDKFGRTFDYVRIAITDRCNLRCTYCMPEEGVEFGHKDTIITTAETLRIISVLAKIGIKKVRFTGGEPTIRKDLPQLIAGAAATPGIKGVHLTTNGLLLHRMAKELLAAGLTGINISLDSMDADRFMRITRRPGVETVLNNIQLALDVGYPRVKVNVVLMRGFNEDELEKFTRYTKDHAVTVRFIEFMPFDADQIWGTGDHFASAETIVNKIKSLYPDIGPAPGTRTEHHIFKVPGWAGKIAVIPAFTRSLCGNCSRIRVTADGSIRNCLYSDEQYNLRQIMRSGGSDADMIALFRKAFAEKAIDGYESKRLSDAKGLLDTTQKHRGSMTQIGG